MGTLTLGRVMIAYGADVKNIRIPVIIDGKQIDELVERRTKAGSMRVFSGAVREF